MTQTTGFTPTEEDVDRAGAPIGDDGHSARAVLATIGPIIERERRAAKVEAWREAADWIWSEDGGDAYAELTRRADEIERADQ